ncbi:MAG: trigger factor [Candidatus Sericytochromatia bacterium]|nr:MAG: trigger factor [Candidatus Sericytochromatia bacterium]
MKVTLERKESNQVCIEVELDAEEVNNKYEKKFRDVSKRVSIPGFRKGKAPRHLVEKYIYTDVLKREVVEDLISESYPKALENFQDLQPITEPKIDLVSFDLNKPLVFKATIEVKPEVKLGQYKGLELTAPKLEPVSEEEVNQELLSLQHRHSTLERVEREIKENDVVKIDIYGEVEGEVIPEGTTNDLMMEIKPGNFVEGFVENLIGCKAGEEKIIELTFPDNYPVVDLRNKAASFKVNIKEVMEVKLPELNDDFVKKVRENLSISSVDELKEKIKEELDRARVLQQVLKNQEVLIEHIVNSSEVEIPDTMLQREMYAMWASTEGNILSEKKVSQDILEASWENWRQREDKKNEASKRIKTTLVLSQIAKNEGLEVTAEELNNELKKFADMYNISVNEVRKRLIDNNKLVHLIDDLLSSKIIKWLESNSKVKIEGEDETSNKDETLNNNVEENKEETLQNKETESI